MKPFLRHIPIAFLGLATILSLSGILLATRDRLLQDRAHLAEETTRRISGLAEQMALLTDLASATFEKDSVASIQKRLNRFVYGIDGLRRLDLKLEDRSLEMTNTFSSDGLFLNGGIPATSCDSGDLHSHRLDHAKYGETAITLCSESELQMTKFIELEDRLLGSFSVVLNIASEDGKNAVLQPSVVPVAFECGLGRTEWCHVPTSSLMFREALYRSIESGFVISLIAALLSFLVVWLLWIPLRKGYFVLQEIAGGAVPDESLFRLGRIFRGFEGSLKRLRQLLLDHVRVREQSASDRARAELAEQIAHDIRTPLTILKDLRRHLSKIPESERGTIERAITRIHGIANDLLQKSGTDSLRIEPLKCKEDLILLVENVLQEVRALNVIGDRGLKITFDLKGELKSVPVWLDVLEVSRVLHNIVGNAVDASPDHGTIRVTLSTAEGKAILSIQDEGDGFDPSEFDLLSTRGFSRKPHGSGLGLYHASETMHLLEGQMTIENATLGGAVVSLIFPLAQSRRNVKRVLIDDDSIVREYWLNRARLAGLELDVYESRNALTHALSQYGPSTEFYIDVDLTTQKMGLSVAKELFESGLTEVFLTTAHDIEQFADFTFAKGTQGKDPPF